MASARSALPETRNPLLKLAAAEKIAALPVDVKAALRALLLELATDAQAKANESWRKHKAPMAAYWKAVAVYARHIARLLK
jgi:hypothetical protein